MNSVQQTLGSAAVISAAENPRKLLINVFYVVPEENRKKNVDKHVLNTLELKVNFLLTAQGLETTRNTNIYSFSSSNQN